MISRPTFARFAEVAVGLPVKELFTYGLPTDMATAQVGHRVLVPFGKRRVTGYILRLSDSGGRDDLKAVLKLPDERPLFPEAMVPFFQWIADYYLHPLGAVIKTALPSGLDQTDQTIYRLTEPGRAALATLPPGRVPHILLKRLETGAASLATLRRSVAGERLPPHLNRMVTKGWIETRQRLQATTAKPLTQTIVSLSDKAPSRMTAQRRRVIGTLAEVGELHLAVLKQMAGVSSAVVGKLVQDGALDTREERLFRDPLGEPIHPDQPLALTTDQQTVMRHIEARAKGSFRPFLLEGVTGSGKTEIYLQLAAKMLAKGRQVLVLVPEIALISQTERRFRARFGDRVAILHSGLTAGERYDQWIRIARGDRPVVIGARSALFAPLADPGLLIVDEEHDAAFKQEAGLRYNARDLAVVRAKLAGATVLLGSATPSVQSLHNAHSGRFVHLQLGARIENRPLAEVEMVDLKAQPHLSGVQRYLSRPLFKAIAETLAREEQVLLFLNRRGFSGHAVCQSCGHAVRCRHCDVAMTLHQAEQQFKCHYCGYSQAARNPCPNCGGAKLIHLGIGTERLERMIATAFPQARVARLDRDTARPKGALRKTLQRLRRRKIDILIGTQMVAKGHDFPYITLVGIVCADLSLHFPDFRAGERTFQLLAQVAGRAGRGERPGRVILQTYSPDHFILQSAQAQRMQPFYAREIEYRRALAYPPFSRLALLLISGRNQRQVAQRSGTLAQIARQMVTGKGDYGGAVQVLGPVAAPLSRISDRYRYQILLKGASSRKLRDFLLQLLARWRDLGKDPGVRLNFDIDPYSML